MEGGILDFAWWMAAAEDGPRLTTDTTLNQPYGDHDTSSFLGMDRQHRHRHTRHTSTFRRGEPQHTSGGRLRNFDSGI